MPNNNLNEQPVVCPVCTGPALYSPVDRVVECLQKTTNPNGHKLMFLGSITLSEFSITQQKTC